MTKIKLSNEQFRSTIETIVEHANSIHEGNPYSLKFDDRGTRATITRTDNYPFYLHYINEFLAVRNLYDCSMWFDVEDGKPSLVFVKDIC